MVVEMEALRIQDVVGVANGIARRFRYIGLTSCRMADKKDRAKPRAEFRSLLSVRAIGGSAKRSEHHCCLTRQNY